MKLTLAIFSLTLLSFALTRPQWQKVKVSGEGGGLKLTKRYKISNTKVGGILGWNPNGGVGLGFTGSQKFGKSTSFSGTVYKTRHDTATKFDVSHGFGQGTTLHGSTKSSKFGSNTNLGLTHSTKHGSYGVNVGHNSKYGGYVGVSATWPFGKRKKRSLPENEGERKDSAQ